jgi:phosphatidylglycerophosphatase A
MSKSKHAPLPASLLRDPIHFLALGFGAGLSPLAPGTAGTLVAVPLVIFIGSFGWTVHAVVTVFLCVVGVFICDLSAKKMQVHDHPGIRCGPLIGHCQTLADPGGRSQTSWRPRNYAG